MYPTANDRRRKCDELPPNVRAQSCDTGHDHSPEQTTLVERGRVRFTIGNEQRIANAGDILYFPSGQWHEATMLDGEVMRIDIF